jgi:hypothetical protein
MLASKLPECANVERLLPDSTSSQEPLQLAYSFFESAHLGASIRPTMLSHSPLFALSN